MVNFWLESKNLAIPAILASAQRFVSPLQVQVIHWSNTFVCFRLKIPRSECLVCIVDLPSIRQEVENYQIVILRDFFWL